MPLQILDLANKKRLTVFFKLENRSPTPTCCLWPGRSGPWRNVR